MLRPKCLHLSEAKVSLLIFLLVIINYPQHKVVHGKDPSPVLASVIVTETNKLEAGGLDKLVATWPVPGHLASFSPFIIPAVTFSTKLLPS